MGGGVVLFAPDACPGGLTLAETAILPSAFRCRKTLEIAPACANGGDFKLFHELLHFGRPRRFLRRSRNSIKNAIIRAEV